MPRPGPRRQNVAVRMSAEQIAALDEAAAFLGVQRSDVVREAVEDYMAKAGDIMAAMKKGPAR